MEICEFQSEYETRLKKADLLKQRGLQPWAEFKKNTHFAGDIFSSIKNHSFSENEEVSFSGRLMLKRDHGKTLFATIQDVTGHIQIYLKEEIVGKDVFECFHATVDIGDFLWIRGIPFETKKNEPTVKVLEYAFLSKSLRPLPEKFHGISDVEQRYRHRYLELVSSSECRTRFIQRSKIVNEIRDSLIEQNFLEVETPMLHPMAGGAAAKPFVTHHNAYNIELYLRIAPELYLKRLVVGGLDRVFEINRNFRNEGVSTKHNPEFTMLEFYMAYGDYSDGMNILESMIKKAANKINPSGEFSFHSNLLNFNQSFATMTMIEAVEKIGNISKADLLAENIDKLIEREKIYIRPGSSFGEKIYTLFEEKVEANIVQPTFITQFPIEVSPLAKRDPYNPNFAARFELFICGMEIANGYTELNDPLDQKSRFEHQMESKEKGNDEAHEFDHEYIFALEHGLPPTVGVGLGIDRLSMLLTGTTSIKDIILFPTLRPKN